MKLSFSVLIALFISVAVMSQAPASSGSSERLRQCLWSYSKNKPAVGKQLIDFNALNDWRTVGWYLSVSNDGKYFAYTINKPKGSLYWFPGPDSLIIQSTSSNWRKSFVAEKEEPFAPGARQGFFSDDGRQYIFQNGGDLYFLQLGTSRLRKIEKVNSYKTNAQNSWVAWQVKNSDTLTVRNFATAKEHKFAGVTDYSFENKRGWLVCRTRNKKDLLLCDLQNNTEKQIANAEAYTFSGSGQVVLIKAINDDASSLHYISLTDGENTNIYTTKQNESIGSYTVDDAGKQVAFTVVNGTNDLKVIWYYQASAGQAKPLARGQSISGELSFLENGKYVQFRMQGKPPAVHQPKDDVAAVEVWNYKDVNLQSTQSKHPDKVASYKAILNCENGMVVFTETSNKKMVQVKGDFALVKTEYKDLLGDRFWEKALYKDSVWIVSLKNGEHHLLSATTNEGNSNFWFSRDSNWLIYFDPVKGCHYYSYNLETGDVKDISANVPGSRLGIGTDYMHGNDKAPKVGYPAAWIEDEASVLVYDTYDIWKLDLLGKQPAVNITHGFGEGKNMVLSLLTSERRSSTALPVVKAQDPILLQGFSRTTKQNGYYRIVNCSVGSPAELSLGNYFMKAIAECHDGNVSNDDGMAPVKAKNANTWIVQRQSPNDAANYYATADFKFFKRLTHLQPQRQYNWLTEELHTFKHLDGVTGQGILYKPENFDATKKYPVVIAFYGAFSNNLNKFCTPTYLDQAMEVGKSPIWFLNNGFLVFTPDIAVTPLRYGQKAFACIGGAAKYLQQLPYVDGNKIGAASHSWSAKLGAYIFTHSTSLAATAISEGLIYANPVNMALSVDLNENNGLSRLEGVEVGMKYGNLWENKEAWLDQTTVLNVDEATSPLLLFCNKESTPDYQDQTFQFFNALRRINKSVWWLKYDNGEHTLHDLKERQDYTIRYTQYFDHYLQNAPAPRWMTQGIPYKLKGIESRYELDPQGACNTEYGEPCLVCQAWNAQFRKTPEMFQKDINEWNLDSDIAQELQKKESERRKELDKQGEVQTKDVMRMLNK